MILAGDVGGTSSRLGLFEPAATRPRSVYVRTMKTLDFGGLAAMIRAFLALRDHEQGDARPAIARACFGVAGPIIGETARLTNVPWTVNAGEVRDAFSIERAALLNDLQAMASSVPVLEPSELHTLHGGEAEASGNLAVIAAGTGLGQALLHRIDSRFVPAPSEAGHADYAARTPREIALLRDLTERYGRAEVEQVVSGPGLINIHRITHDKPCEAVNVTSEADLPAQISLAALERRCPGCVEALELFVDAYGAEAGNLALRSLATGGIFIGGGVGPKILPALTDGRFLEAFLSKGAMRGLLERIPVQVILNNEAGLLGAAVFATSL